MSDGLRLPRFSVGVGDRFAHQARAQLAACLMTHEQGVEVVPVWNKSNREHMIIGSEPGATRAAAESAVKELGWTKPYFIDADHINLSTVERFVGPCDFFTIDVADWIGRSAAEESVGSVCGEASGADRRGADSGRGGGRFGRMQGLCEVWRTDFWRRWRRLERSTGIWWR